MHDVLVVLIVLGVFAGVIGLLFGFISAIMNKYK